MLPSASFDSVGTPNSMISRLNGWPVRTPVQRFACVLADADAGLGAIVDRYSFDVERSHLLLHAGLSRRSKRPATPSEFAPVLARQHDDALAKADFERARIFKGTHRGPERRMKGLLDARVLAVVATSQLSTEGLQV